MDYDVISNISYNFTFDDIPPEESMSMILHEIIFSIICLVGIIADGLIIYIIQRFKNMRNPTNIYIMNWLISDAVYLLITPCFYRIFSALEDFFIGEEIVCVSFELASILQITSIMFISVLCANWFLIVFSVSYREYYKYIVFIIWMIALSGILTFSSFCIRHLYSLFSHYLLFYGYAVLMLVVISMHIVKKIKINIEHEKLSLNLTLVSVYVICWFPSWLCLLVTYIIESYFVLYYLSIAAACLGYLNPLINLYVFSRMNKNFHMCLMQVFKYVHRDYDDASDSYDESDDESFNQA